MTAQDRTAATKQEYAVYVSLNCPGYEKRVMLAVVPGPHAEAEHVSKFVSVYTGAVDADA